MSAIKFLTTPKGYLLHYFYIFFEYGAIGYINREYGMLEVGYKLTPIYPKGGGGYKDVRILKISWRYFFVHEETRYFY